MRYSGWAFYSMNVRTRGLTRACVLQAAAKAAAEADAAKKAEEEGAARAVASASANAVSSPSTAVRSESELTGASKVLEDK